MSASRPPTETLGGLLRQLADERPEDLALVHPRFAHGGVEVRRSFADLDARVDAISRGLVAQGIAAGDHVAVWAANVPDWVPLEFALARVGAVLVTVNTALKADEVAYVLAQSRTSAVLHTTRTGSNEASAILDGLLEGPAPRLPGLRLRAWLRSLPDETPPEGFTPARREGGEARPGRLASLDDWIIAGRDLPEDALAAREAAVGPGDLVNIQYTSGTTGFPKGVMLSHANLLVSARALGDQVRVEPRDKVAVIVPLFHCFGCVVAVLGAYTRGAGLAFLPSFEPGDALRLIEAERCTIVHGVPTMFSAMLAHPDLTQRDVSSLRTGLVAGAPCPVPLMRAIVDRLGCADICVAYGLTEAAPGVSGTYPEDPIDVRCGTIGRALPGLEVRVTDPETGLGVPDGAQGEIWVRGPNVMLGYHDDPEATAAAVTRDGWLRTGDLAVRGDDGNMRIVGRSKDIIIRGGENIAPAEIENVLREHPDIVDAAVVGVPDAHFGEEVACALILADGARLDPSAYESLLHGRVAVFKVPRLWRSYDSFPLTGSGKVQKYRLRESFSRD